MTTNTNDSNLIKRVSIGRFLCYIRWSLDGLWWNDTKTERIFYWLNIGHVSRGDRNAFTIIVFKLRFTCGIRPATKKSTET